MGKTKGLVTEMGYKKAKKFLEEARKNLVKKGK